MAETPSNESSTMPEKTIALIGCGAIGTSLAGALSEGKIPNAKLVAIFDIILEKANSLAKTLKQPIRTGKSVNELLTPKPDLAIEAASQAAVHEYAERILTSGIDLLIMSTGALLDEELYLRLQKAAEEHHRRIYVPTGAIGAIDAIRATLIGGLKEVTLTTRKPPQSLAGAPFFTTSKIDLTKIKKPQLIYEGPAREAIALFPANVNVAAILSLAGLGAERTKVRIIADPTIRANIHRVEAVGNSGKITAELENQPHPMNPKTSFLAVLSALELLRQICNPMIKIGT
jgi:aspartate dehydrogenase